MATRALHHALELAERPSLAGIMRQQALPPDVITLIRIAAGSPETLAEEAARTGRSQKTIRDAAVLYLQQVLFHQGADAYRILGLAPGAPQEELGQHMRLLMKWLHPDRDRGDWESAFAERVSGAWDLVKSAERRVRYDATLPKARPASRRRKSSGRRRLRGLQRLPSVERNSQPERSPSSGVAMRSAAALILVVIAIAFFVMPEWTGWLGAGQSFDGDSSLASGTTGN
jgi:hypothetical protein